MSQTNTGSGQLSTVLKAEAKMAMPEMVAVFLSDYETALYDKKAELTNRIAELQDEQKIFNEDARTKGEGKFTKYDGLALSKIGVKTVVSDVLIDWDGNTWYVNVSLIDTDTPVNKQRRDFGKRFSVDLPSSLVAKRQALRDDEKNTRKELESVIAKIGDMSRKERQVKARISKLRLEEEGLTQLLNDSEMKKLVQI